jgi:hypothetical protein
MAIIYKYFLKVSYFNAAFSNIKSQRRCRCRSSASVTDEAFSPGQVRTGEIESA